MLFFPPSAAQSWSSIPPTEQRVVPVSWGRVYDIFWPVRIEDAPEAKEEVRS